jgi:hypothetical protein
VVLGTAMQKKNQSCLLKHGKSSGCRGETALQKKKPKKKLHINLVVSVVKKKMKKMKKNDSFFLCVYIKFEAF